MFKSCYKLLPIKIYQNGLQNQPLLQHSLDVHVALLRRYGNLKHLTYSKITHAHLVRSGLNRDPFLGNVALETYIKCSSLDDAWLIFHRMKARCVFSWNLMIRLYVRQGNKDEALECFQQMLMEGIMPDKFTFSTVFGVFDFPQTVSEGKRMHAFVLIRRLQLETVVMSAVTNMYGKCGCLKDAQSVFENMIYRDVAAWNTMITVYELNDSHADALQLFQQMQLHDLLPDKYTYINILNVCANMEIGSHGKRIHAYILLHVLQPDTVVYNALMCMYVNCNSLRAALMTFRGMPKQNLVTWTTLIRGYSQNGDAAVALELYKQTQAQNLVPDDVSFASALDACALKAAASQGKWVHSDIICKGFESQVLIGTTLVNMYGKCGNMIDARRMFGAMPERNLISWNAMITACAVNGYGKDALFLFEEMQVQHLLPDKATIINILDACGSLSSVSLSRDLTDCITRNGFETDTVVQNALLHFYGKAGLTQDAHRIFNGIQGRDVLSWNTMIAVYAQHGDVKKALSLYQQMILEGLIPNEVTFVNVFLACSHVGLACGGYHHFLGMVGDHGIVPTMDHSACMIDLLGRGGWLFEAHDWINSLLLDPKPLLWTILLAACRVHGGFHEGRNALERILGLSNLDVPLYAWPNENK